MINLENRRNQNIAVLGLGVSGLMAARALQRSGANVLAWDDNENQCKEAVAAGIPIVNLYKKSFRIEANMSQKQIFRFNPSVFLFAFGLCSRSF